MDLDVDTDRDGSVENTSDDDNNEELWSTAAGAVFYHNLDDDDNNGSIDCDDSSLNGAADALDLARLVVRQSSGLSGATVSIEVASAARGNIRIFQRNGSSWTSVYATGASFTLAASTLSAGDIELGLEGNERLSPTWDGQVQLTLTIRDSSGVLQGTDVVRLRCAPWLMATNLWSVEELHVVDDDQYNQPFRTTLQQACTAGGILYREAPGSQYGYDIWLQDSSEPGIIYLPDAAGTRRRVDSVLQCARYRPVDDWCEDVLFGPEFDFVDRFGSSQGSLNYGGNLEIVPPHNVPGGASYPWGRVAIGGGTSNLLAGNGSITRTMDSAYHEYFEANGYQSDVLEISTEWLAVGHLDEHTSFIPAPGTARGWVLALGMPSVAYADLQAVAAAGGGNLPVFNNRGNHERTVNAILGDVSLMNLNSEVQAKMDAIKQKFKTEIGLTDAEIIELPVLFEDAGGGYGVAYNPGVVNMVVMPTANNGIQLVVPDPEGPDLPTDVWQDTVRTKLEALGTAANPVTVWFADVFYSYHVNLGEAHCGTNTVRTPPAMDWWNQ